MNVAECEREEYVSQLGKVSTEQICGFRPLPNTGRQSAARKTSCRRLCAFDVVSLCPINQSFEEEEDVTNEVLRRRRIYSRKRTESYGRLTQYNTSRPRTRQYILYLSTVCYWLGQCSMLCPPQRWLSAFSCQQTTLIGIFLSVNHSDRPYPITTTIK